MASGGRPSRVDELEEVARLAGASTESVRSFFFRPGRLSAALRQRIADAVAETGYRPSKSTRALLRGMRIGYQLPRVGRGSTVSPVQVEHLHRLVVATQRAGAVLVPFVVDPPVTDDLDVRGGTEAERNSAELGGGGFLRRYAHSIAPDTYREMLRTQSVSAFVIEEPQVDDVRVAAMTADGIPVVSTAAIYTTGPSGALEVDPGATFVANDYDAGFAALAESLRSAGCTDFAHIRFATDGTAVPVARRASVRKALGDVPSLEVHYETSLHRRPEPAVEDFLRTHRPGAVICDSDDLAYLVHLSALQVGLEPGRRPGDGRVVLTGVDDAAVREQVPPDQRWPTLAHDYQAFVDEVIAVLISQRDRGPAPHQRYVPPLLVGGLDQGPEGRRTVGRA